MQKLYLQNNQSKKGGSSGKRPNKQEASELNPSIAKKKKKKN
jgi:hypothetical protein